MADDALFPPTPQERLASLDKFVEEERCHRARMGTLHPDQALYWQKHVTQCDEALAHLAALAEAVTP